MLIGTHRLRLNKNYAFRLPKRMADELYSSITQKEVCFAAADCLCCYPLYSVQTYLDELAESHNVRLRQLAKLTMEYGITKVSFGRMLRIPEVFCKIYHYQPDMKITLLGCGDHIELQ